MSIDSHDLHVFLHRPQPPSRARKVGRLDIAHVCPHCLASQGRRASPILFERRWSSPGSAPFPSLPSTSAPLELPRAVFAGMAHGLRHEQPRPSRSNAAARQSLVRGSRVQATASRPSQQSRHARTRALARKRRRAPNPMARGLIKRRRGAAGYRQPATRGTFIGGGICSFRGRCPPKCPLFLGGISRRN